MSFRINDTTLEQIIERVEYEVIRKIPSLTGPTGPVANEGVLLADGTLINNIIPAENNFYSLGSSSSQFSKIYTHTIYINGKQISTNINNVIELQEGNMKDVGAIGTIKILGSKSNPS